MDWTFLGTPQATAVMGLIGAALGATATYLPMSRQNDQERRNEAAKFLESLAEALEAIAEAHEKRQIPYNKGNFFRGALDNVNNVLRPYMNEKSRSALQTLLKKQHMNSKGFDSEGGDEIWTERQRQDWIKDMKCTAGQLPQIATKIRNRTKITGDLFAPWGF